MHLFKRRIFFGILSILLMVGSASAYKNEPALIHLNAEEQPDTTGFNLVSSITQLFFQQIMEGKVNLYNGPGKQAKINAAALLSLQESSGTIFTECKDMFIHEYWSSNRRSTSFQVVGFSFINKNQLNEKVSFGFIDLKEVQDLLQHSRIPTTANGSWDVSYEQALMSRKYKFHLVQLGRNAFHGDPVKAVKEKQYAFNNEKPVRTQVNIPESKRLLYEVVAKKYTTDIDLSNTLMEAIQSVLNAHPELYLNLGGDAYTNFPDTVIDIPRVTGILVEEIWKKDNRKPVLDQVQIRIITSEGDLEWIDLEELEARGLFIRYESARNIFIKKPFEFELQKVNDQEISRGLGMYYLDAITKTHWSRIEDYVQSL